MKKLTQSRQDAENTQRKSYSTSFTNDFFAFLCGYLATLRLCVKVFPSSAKILFHAMQYSDSQNSEPKILVIGFGNPLRGDDGAGWYAAEQLAKVNDCDDVEILTRHQLTPELAEPISRAARIIFIDASANETSGKISCQWIKPEARTSTSFSHYCDPSSLLTIANQLYGRHPDAVLLTIAGESFDHNENLSPAVMNKMPALLQRARELMIVK